MKEAKIIHNRYSQIIFMKLQYKFNFYFQVFLLVIVTYKIKKKIWKKKFSFYSYLISFEVCKGKLYLQNDFKISLVLNDVKLIY